MSHYDDEEEPNTALCNERKIFLGNLPFKTRSEDVEMAFNKFGSIIGINIRKDRDSGRPKGFGFVTFDSEYAANSAISEMNGKLFQGRSLTVRQAILRNSVQPPESVVEDSSWKTVPSEKKTKSSIKSNSTDKFRNGVTNTSKETTSTSNTASRKTWENWAGPIKK